MSTLAEICTLPPISNLVQLISCKRDNSVPHAPVRKTGLDAEGEKLALKNALRYFPECAHKILAPEFMEELRRYGHIYMYRFRPELEMRAYPIEQYPAKCEKAAAIMLMIMNNLDDRVAQFPHELVTYGGNGQVFSNWYQFRLVMHYLSIMTEEQTLVMYSGHPLGLFPSSKNAPRLVITNGMVIPNYSSTENYDKMFALGVTMYGQMTAGSYCYIGPQGIVHGTTITVLNAGRKYLGLNDLSGKVYLTSGLGGMSGAQAKAAVICGCIGVVAEVRYEAIKKLYNQGWVMEIVDDLERLVERIREARKKKEATSIAYYGNVVDVWERMVRELEVTGELLADLGSDQTSCHNAYNGGYFPVQMSFETALEMMTEDPASFKQLVQESLRRQVDAINKLTSKGMFFWDYGNAFLLEAHRAGADVGYKKSVNGARFRYPSYVQDIMGDIFSLGFGPFRWVCTTSRSDDLEATDRISKAVLMDLLKCEKSEPVRQQLQDNIRWISDAGKHKLNVVKDMVPHLAIEQAAQDCWFQEGNTEIFSGTLFCMALSPLTSIIQEYMGANVVGSQARILYSDQKGRTAIALAFNDAIKCGKIKGPLVLSRDHHDVSGTDSPFRETSNIYDGSAFTADMAVQNCIGDAFRGATWVALHNGGGVGWGEVINGGFGLVLDGTDEAAHKAKMMLSWDVSNGVARRAWSGNSNAQETICRTIEETSGLNITLPYQVSDDVIMNLCYFKSH